MRSLKIIYQISQDDLVTALKEILSNYIPQIVPGLVKKQEERLITSDEALKILACSSSNLWRMVKANLIQTVGNGKHRRYK